jgi:hypothetical protein
MEALVAIGLASNIVQFVSFSSEVLSKFHKIYESSGITEEFTDTELIVKNLRDITKRIDARSTSDINLATLARLCTDVGNELLEATSQLSVDPSQTRQQRWKAFRRALKSVWKKNDLLHLQTRLSGLRDQLMLSLASETR